MNEEKNQTWQQIVWRRRRSPEEDKNLQDLRRADPSLDLEIAQDERLTGLISSIRNVPVSSNFTARVMHEARRSATPLVVRTGWSDLHRRWIARLSFAALALFLGIFSFQQYQSTRRHELARNIAAISEAAALPPIEWLQDFEIIRNMGNPPVIDDELIALMQSK